MTIEAHLKTSAELSRKVREKRAEVAAIEADLEDYAHAEGLGTPGAAAAAETARANKAKVEEALQRLVTEQASLENKLRRLTELRDREQEVERRQRVAKLSPRYLKTAEKIDALGRQLGRSLQEMQDIGTELAQAAGTVEARRLLRFDASKGRVQKALYLPLMFDVAVPAAAQSAGAGLPTQAHWLDLSVNTRADTKAGLVDRTRQVLDHIQDVFATEQEAREVARRLDDTGQAAHVIADPTTGLWHLVRNQLRGAARALAKAANKGAAA